MPGTTNFQQWNPGSANQETDAAYLADSQRAGGAAVGSPFPSHTANKLFYQTSTGITALMQMMATKGYNVTDTSMATLASALAAIQTTADQKGLLQLVTWSSTVTCDASKFNGFEILLRGNTTILLTGYSPGQIISFHIGQDATGNRTVVWPSGFFGAFQPDPSPQAVSVIIFEVASDLTGRCIGPTFGITAAAPHGIVGTPIGLVNPSTGQFSGLTVLGAAVLQALSCASLAVSGAATANTVTTNGETINGDIHVTGNSTLDGTVNSGTQINVNQQTAQNIQMVNGSLTNTPLQTDYGTNIITSFWAKSGLAMNLNDGTATANGYFIFPTWMGSLRMCWGTASASGGNPTPVNITFPSSFFSNVFIILPVSIPPTRTVTYVTSLSNSGATIETAGSVCACYFLAIGV